MNRALTSLEGYAVEWFAALAMLAWAVALALPGEMLAGERFRAFDLVPIGDIGWMVVFAACALGRMIALYINGHFPIKTPRYRIGFATFGFFVWGFISLALLSPVWKTVSWEALSLVGPAFMICGLLSLFELFSVYRARVDGRYAQRRAADVKLAKLASVADQAIAEAGVGANASRS